MRRLTAAVVIAASASILAATLPSSADARPSLQSRPGSLATLRPGPAPAAPTSWGVDDARGGAALRAAATATFDVDYQAGFPDDARVAFQRAVDLWATRITSTVPITVEANYIPLGTGVLGSAGSTNIWADFDGARRPGVWFVDATANKAFGRQLEPETADIVANFSSDFPNWHFGTGSAPSGKYDFTTVVMHELGHGLGFIGAGDVVGSGSAARGSLLISGSPTVFDLFTETNAGVGLLRYPENSQPLAAALQGGRLSIDTPAIRRVAGGRPARLFAPSTFQQGSSYSHLDEITYRAGTPNSLMTPLLGPGETIRDPGPITMAVMSAVGW